MLVITSTDSDGNPRRLTVARDGSGAVLRLYRPVLGDSAEFTSDLEGEFIAGIRLSSADVDALTRSL